MFSRIKNLRKPFSSIRKRRRSCHFEAANSNCTIFFSSKMALNINVHIIMRPNDLFERRVTSESHPKIGPGPVSRIGDMNILFYFGTKTFFYYEVKNIRDSFGFAHCMRCCRSSHLYVREEVEFVEAYVPRTIYYHSVHGINCKTYFVVQSELGKMMRKKYFPLSMSTRWQAPKKESRLVFPVCSRDFFSDAGSDFSLFVTGPT